MEAILGAVRNNGGGHWNHSFFWKLMKAGAEGKPVGKLADAITTAFGSFEAFQEKFAAAVAARWRSASMCGSTPTTSITRTAAPIT